MNKHRSIGNIGPYESGPYIEPRPKAATALELAATMILASCDGQLTPEQEERITLTFGAEDRHINAGDTIAA